MWSEELGVSGASVRSPRRHTQIEGKGCWHRSPVNDHLTPSVISLLKRLKKIVPEDIAIPEVFGTGIAGVFQFKPSGPKHC